MQDIKSSQTNEHLGRRKIGFEYIGAVINICHWEGFVGLSFAMWWGGGPFKRGGYSRVKMNLPTNMHWDNILIL